LLVAVFELVSFMIVPRDLPVHYYVFYAIQKVHFIITLVSLGYQNEHYNEVVLYNFTGGTCKSLSNSVNG